MAFLGPCLRRSMACLLLACAVLSGCGSSEARARDAYGRYQAAAAANDMVGAQRALMQLVAIEDRVSEYWIELAKIQAATGSPRDAYHSLTRAYELDRSNVGLLRALTEFALRGNDPATAQVFARELEVVAPGDPWVNLTRGYVALRESRFDDALSASDEVLETSPFDTHAKALKARALLGKRQDDEAIGLLLDQIRVEPSDAICLQVLANVYEIRRDWPRLSQIARRLAQLQPTNNGHALLAITAAFKAGQSEQGRRDSWKLITSGASADLVSRVLDIWFDNWPAQQRVADAIKLGRAARDPQQRLPYADFLNRVGSPVAALELVNDVAKYPVAADNADANAVAAEALVLSGKSSDAIKRFGAVLAFDPGNSIALRGRSKQLLRVGRAKDAIADAEKLVTVSPASARDRLLLARAYTAANDAQQAQRTLWDAFQAIPANEQIYGALDHLTRSNADKRLALKEEFARQTATKINHGLL